MIKKFYEYTDYGLNKLAKKITPVRDEPINMYITWDDDNKVYGLKGYGTSIYSIAEWWGGPEENFWRDLTSKYDIDVIKFLEEILMNKTIAFISVKYNVPSPHIKVEKIDIVKGDFSWDYVRINDKWLIDPTKTLIIQDYDMNTYKKPEHQKLAYEKEFKKYNL